MPENRDDILTAYSFCVDHKMRVSVQSTGQHQDVRNIYDNSVHFDLSKMKRKVLDIVNSQITVETGNNFGDIHEFIRSATNQTLVVMSGYDRGVGPYGWTTGGGHGIMTRMFGLGVDALLNVELLLANGTIINANEKQNSDLFRGLRGGAGPSFGLALNMTIKLFPTPGKLSVYQGIYSMNDTSAELFGNFLVNGPNAASGYYKPYNLNISPFIPYVQIEVFCLNSYADCPSLFAPLNKTCIVVEPSIHCKILTFDYPPDYFLAQQSSRGGNMPNTPSAISIYGTYFNSANLIQGLKDVNNFILNNKNFMCTGNGVLGGQSALNDMGGKFTSVDPAMRSSIMSMSCGAALFEDNSNASRTARMTTLTLWGESTLKKYSKSVYWNEPMHDFPEEDWKERYWGSLDNYNNLLAIKQKYDPTNYFTCYHCIGYDQSFSGKEPSLCPSESSTCTCNNNLYGQCSVTTNINSFYLKYSAFILILLIFVFI
jgi:hypothetical protein